MRPSVGHVKQNEMIINSTPESKKTASNKHAEAIIISRKKNRSEAISLGEGEAKRYGGKRDGEEEKRTHR